MTEYRSPHLRVIVSTLAVLLLSACSDATEPAPGKSRAALEDELQRTHRQLEQSRLAVDAAQGRLRTLVAEQTRDRRRVAELTAHSADLQRQNRELRQHLARAQGQIAQSAGFQKTLRQQRDQNAGRLRALSSEHRAMGNRLAGAQGEIRRLQARRSPGPRQTPDGYQRRTVAARELDELRRYNGFLLQERSNLQTWLQEANATRKRQQDALRLSQQEADSDKSDARAANRKLRVERDKANQALADLETSRDALAKETQRLQAAVTTATETERARSEELARALADTETLADARDRLTAELQRSRSADGDAKALRSKLEQATSTIAKLRSAKGYLVEKIEACTLQQRSSRAEREEQAKHLALLGRKLRSMSASESLPQSHSRFMPASWQPGPAMGVSRQSWIIPVATQTDEQPKSTRRKKELDQTKQKLKKLELEQETLTKALLDLETECAAVKDQVQTLTWANEVLVKELEAAYKSREAGATGLLPEGSRGIYVLRAGESLSRVAKAFYGDAGRWRDLVEANKDKIPDPDMVKAGTIIVIPE
ncbi:MAG: LysM peptidoglycan-binding domain-containing protein [Gammaproteobacteria bacterium]